MGLGVQPHLFEHRAELPLRIIPPPGVDRTDRHRNSTPVVLSRDINVVPTVPHLAFTNHVTALAGSEGHALSSFPIRRRRGQYGIRRRFRQVRRGWSAQATPLF